MKIEMHDCVYRFVPVMGYGLMPIETFKVVLSLYMRCLSSSSVPTYKGVADTPSIIEYCMYTVSVIHT